MFRPFLDRIGRSLPAILLDGADGIRRFSSSRKRHIGSGVVGLEGHAPVAGRTKQRATRERIMTTMAVAVIADQRLAASLDAGYPRVQRAGAVFGLVTDTMSATVTMMRRPVARGPPLFVLHYSAA